MLVRVLGGMRIGVPDVWLLPVSHGVLKRGRGEYHAVLAILGFGLKSRRDRDGRNIGVAQGRDLGFNGLGVGFWGVEVFWPSWLQATQRIGN